MISRRNSTAGSVTKSWSNYIEGYALHLGITWIWTPLSTVRAIWTNTHSLSLSHHAKATGTFSTADTIKTEINAMNMTVNHRTLQIWVTINSTIKRPPSRWYSTPMKWHCDTRWMELITESQWKIYRNSIILWQWVFCTAAKSTCLITSTPNDLLFNDINHGMTSDNVSILFN